MLTPGAHCAMQRVGDLGFGQLGMVGIRTRHVVCASYQGRGGFISKQQAAQ